MHFQGRILFGRSLLSGGEGELGLPRHWPCRSISRREMNREGCEHSPQSTKGTIPSPTVLAQLWRSHVGAVFSWRASGNGEVPQGRKPERKNTSGPIFEFMWTPPWGTPRHNHGDLQVELNSCMGVIFRAFILPDATFQLTNSLDLGKPSHSPGEQCLTMGHLSFPHNK